MMTRLLVVLSLIYGTGFAPFGAAREAPGTAPLAPYLTTEAGDVVPLLLTDVEVTIDGVIADVRMTQHFTNAGATPIEALYVFPGSTRAAVYAVDMVVGGRVIRAEIAEKADAQETYEAAVEQGQTASLLDQIDPQFFSMRVGNILPDDDVRVSIHYVEEVDMLPASYRLVVPARRATSVLGVGSTARERLALKGEKSTGFHLQGSIHAPVEITSIGSPSHTMDVDVAGRIGTFALNEDELFAERADVVIEYQLANQTMQTGVTVYEGQDADFFLMLAQPPARSPRRDVTPREYIFVVDVSGSMSGFPIDAARSIMNDLLGGLASRDRFNIILFAGAAGKLHPESVPASAAAIQHALEYLSEARAGGGTDLLAALRLAHKSPETSGVSRSIVAITDGGIYLPDETLRFISDHLDDANMFALGVGAGADHPVIERLARAGRGRSLVIADKSSLNTDVEAISDYLSSPLLTDVQMLVSEPAAEILPADLPDVFLQRPVFAVGRVPSGAGGIVSVQGLSTAGTYQASFDLQSAPRGSRAIAYLWAREQLRWLETEPIERIRKDRMTAVGLEFGLLTAYTSFVAIDEAVRNVSGRPAQVGLNRIETSGSRQLISVGFNLPPIEIGSAVASVMVANVGAGPEPIENRPSITLIGADGAADPSYLSAAAQFFASDSSLATEWVIPDVTDLSAVRELLLTHAGDEPWGIVNLVVHGSPWSGLALAIGPDQADVSVQTLSDVRPWDRLRPGIVDEKTQIRVFACGIGRQPRLLEALSRRFAGDQGAPLVLASDEQSYFIRSHGQTVAATLHHPWLLDRRKLDPAAALRQLGAPPAGTLRIEPVVVTYRGAIQRSRSSAASMARRVDALRDYFEPLGVSASQLRWRVEGDTLVGRGWLAQYLPDPQAATLLSEEVIAQWPAVRANLQ